MKESFGQYIKKLRKDGDLTLTQLAAKLRMDSANLSKIENGKRNLDERKIELLSEVFNLDLEELKAEYYSERFAMKIYEVDCSEKTLSLAEEKVKYLKQKNTKQGNLNF